MVIYKTTNIINGKFYIGKDSRNNPSYLGSGLALLKALEKYGRENFKKEILEICSTLEELSKAEIYWAEKLDAYNREKSYNIAICGQGGNLGPDVNKKISEGVARYCRKRSDEEKTNRLIKFKQTIQMRDLEKKKKLFENMSKAKKGQSSWLKGKPMPEETKAKLRKPKSEEFKNKLRNKIRTPEHSANISKAKTGKPVPKFWKKVNQLDIVTGDIIKTWSSMTEAAKALNTTCSNIKKIIDKKGHHCKGYKWAYAD